MSNATPHLPVSLAANPKLSSWVKFAPDGEVAISPGKVEIGQGIVTALAGFGLFSFKGWARWFAIVVVFINLIGQFAWFPAFPLWSMVAIALNIFVLFALTVRWQEARSVLRS